MDAIEPGTHQSLRTLRGGSPSTGPARAGLPLAIKDVYLQPDCRLLLDSQMRSPLAVTTLHHAATRVVTWRAASCTPTARRRAEQEVHALKRHSMAGSMGRVGAADHNAAIESFFSLLQKSVLDRQIWNPREELRIAIVRWIERTCHRRRRQTSLGRTLRGPLADRAG